MMRITDSVRSFFLNKSESIDLELKLNVTKHGKEWREVGDALYNYGATKAPYLEEYIVTTEQYDFLTYLNTKPSYEVCRDLSVKDIK